MGKYLYSGVMKRWLYNSDIGKDTSNNIKSPTKQIKSAVFKDGYDDPTYMTFKVEFGDWGASVLPRHLIELGTTQFRPDFEDYDALPIGLLNCPYDLHDQYYDAYWQNTGDSSTFNNTRLYSAFAYLRSRNEDTRAKYLYYFVNGLFEILKDYPFIFKKISGLQDLEKFDPKSGQRLKAPAKITLECYEGLDLKIRTLLEFYRKAAWDDIYQRWILPENMREFKMIIYVFERRIFLDVKSINTVIDGVGEHQMLMTYSDLNGDIPVKAYECCPCEINIGDSQSWKGEYDAGWNSNSDETSKIVIEVKNVKTFFKNNLLSDLLSKMYDQNGKNIENANDTTLKINSIMIYDLVESIERTSSFRNDITPANASSAISDLTVNGARALFLDKNILLENEETYNHKDNFNYIWGYGNKPVGTTNDYELSIKSVRKLLIDLSYMDDNMRTSWVFSLSSGPTYDPDRSFWQNLGDNISNVLTGARRLILISGAANIQMIRNCLIEPFHLPLHIYNYIENPRLLYVGSGRSRRGDTSKNPANPISSILLSEIDKLDLEFRRVDDSSAPALDSEFRPKYTLDGTIDNPADNISSIVVDKNIGLHDEGRTIEDQTFSDLTSRELSGQKYITLDSERKMPELEYLSLDKNRNIPAQEYNGLDKERQIPEQEFRNINPERQLPEQDFNEIGKERDLPKQDFELLDKERDLPGQTYEDLDKVRELPKLSYQELDKERIPDAELMDLLLVARSLPGLESISLDEIRKIPKLKLLDLKEAEIRSIPSFESSKSALLEEIKKVEGTNMKLLELDKGNKQVEDTTLEFLKLSSALQTLKVSKNETDDELTNKLKAVTAFTLEFVKNSDKIRKVYVDSILSMKDTLRLVTTEIVTSLPAKDTYILKNGEKDKHNIESALLSLNDIDQINSNMQFLSIKDTDVEKLSFQSLIHIQEELSKAVASSQAVAGLTKIVKNSVDTEPNEKFRKNANKSVLEEPRKKPTLVL